jgi:hypothetical protein
LQVRVLHGSSPQDDVLLTGEREKYTPFSPHLRPQESLAMSIKQLLAYLRFDKKVKLDNLGIDIDINTQKIQRLTI